MNITQILDACTGCGVCAAVCPSAAVRMQPDAHGFLRPVVDDAACTDCGLCTRKCPVSVLPQNSAHTDVLTGYAKDGTLLPRSSSGAIFPVLAAEIIRRGGLVFGAAFDGQFQVVQRGGAFCALQLQVCPRPHSERLLCAGQGGAGRRSLGLLQWDAVPGRSPEKLSRPGL